MTAAQKEIWTSQVRNYADNNTLDVLLAMVNSNASMAYFQANAAYTQANLAYTTAKNAYGVANLAYNQANAAYNGANAAYTVGTNAQGTANYGVSLAGLAYNQANTATAAAAAANVVANRGVSIGTSAYNQANVAYSEALTAYNTATAASGVTSGVYGSASEIPIFQVDVRGRVVGAYNTPLYTNLGQSLGPTGYTKLPNGLVIQWGSTSVTNGNGQLVSYPLVFPTQCFVITFGSIPVNEENIPILGSSAPAGNRAGFNLYSSIPSGTTVCWTAIGY